MTFEEVVEEMRKHLAERCRIEDELVPLASWQELLTPEPTYRTWLAQRLKTHEPEFLEVYRAAVRERRQAFHEALRVASAERRSLAAVAHRFGRHKVQAYRARRMGLRPMRERLDLEAVRKALKVGMTLAELAEASGLKKMSLHNWVRRGMFGGLAVLHKRKIGKPRREHYVVVEVLDGD